MIIYGRIINIGLTIGVLCYCLGYNIIETVTNQILECLRESFPNLELLSEVCGDSFGLLLCFPYALAFDPQLASLFLLVLPCPLNEDFNVPMGIHVSPHVLVE